MPCWKITTGQPAAGCVRPLLAFGSVASTGMRRFGTRASGVGFCTFGGASCALTQKLVSGFAGSP